MAARRLPVSGGGGPRRDRAAAVCAVAAALAVIGPGLPSAVAGRQGAPPERRPDAGGAPSGYTFLGDLEEHRATEAGLELRCRPGARLAVRFLAADVFRVTVRPPGSEEPRLEEALVEAERDPVDLRRAEDEGSLRLRTDALELVVHKAPCRLEVLDASGRVVARDEPGLGVGWDGREVRNWKTIAEGERFFGLGEKTGDVDKRGREWVMWNSDVPGYDEEDDPLYQSIPFFIGVRGGRAFGIYLNDSHRTVFNMGAGNHRYYSFASHGGLLDYFFFQGPAIGRVVDAYTELTGRPALPPAWALGYHQSRWSYYPQAEVERLAATFREKGIPADAIHLDIHYMDGYRVFTWDPERFPDPQGMLERLGSLGFKPVLIIDPGVKADSAFPVAAEGLRGEHFVRYPDGEVYVGSVWPGRSFFPDFSRPATRAWWGAHIARLREQGVRGIWNDMNEPAVWGRAFPLEVLMEDGGRRSSQKRMHNLYGLQMTRAAWEGLKAGRPEERPFLLTRAGFAGVQRYAAVWTGDNVATWEHLELGIRMMLGMGLSGVPFVGTDVGGFIGSPEPELFARWMQVGALSPFFRTHTAHGTPEQEPWSFGEEVERIAREAVRLRYRWLPYLYTLMREAHRTGAPVLRPLFWHHPDDPAAYDRRWQHQFLVGERVLAAPVTGPGRRLQRVYLPAGRWLDPATGSTFRGPDTAVVEAPLDRIPVLLAEGAILPTTEARPHVREGLADPLFLDIYAPAAAASLELYEDDGISDAHSEGRYRLTDFALEPLGGGAPAGAGAEPEGGPAGLRLIRRTAHAGYGEEGRAIEVRLHAREGAPSAVRLDGRPLRRLEAGAGGPGWGWDGERGVLTVRFEERGSRQRLEIEE